MSDRQETEARLTIGGRPYVFRVISNPLIDDVVITEARIYADALEHGSTNQERRVDLGIRDFLIRLGVER